MIVNNLKSIRIKFSGEMNFKSALSSELFIESCTLIFYLPF